jgi:hypothetical protein
MYHILDQGKINFKIMVCWDTTLYSCVDGYWLSGGTWCMYQTTWYPSQRTVILMLIAMRTSDLAWGQIVFCELHFLVCLKLSYLTWSIHYETPLVRAHVGVSEGCGWSIAASMLNN